MKCNTSVSKSVLIVEDEPELLEILALELKLSGYDVATAADGQTAMNILKARPVDLVISDLYMPGQDGLQLVDYLNQQISPRPLIVLISGAINNDDPLPEGRQVEAQLAKPFDSLALHAVIQKVFEQAANQTIN